MNIVLRLLYLFFTILFTRGALEEYLKVNNFILDSSMLMLSLLILLICYICSEEFILPPISILFFSYIIWGFLSTVFTSTPIYFFLTYFRIIIITYCIYATIYNASFTKEEIHRLILFVFGLMILQIFASAFEMFILGKHDEYRIGFMIFGSGGYATVFPLLAMGYGFAIYYFSPYKHSIIFFVFSWLFLLIGLASGKRAVMFFAPALFAISFILYCFFDKRRKKILFKRILFFALISIIMIRVFFFLISQVGKFGIISEGSTLSEKLSLINFIASEYTFRGLYANEEYSTGRGTNLVKAWNMAWDRKYQDFWLGGGPLSTADHRHAMMLEKYKFGYGIPGVVYEMLNIGVPGVILYMCLMLSVWFNLFKYARFSSLNSVGKILFFGLFLNLFSFLFIHIYYFNAFLVNIMGGILIFSVLAILIAPQNKMFFNKKEDIDLLQDDITVN